LKAGDAVLFGLYCSLRCAGLPWPADRPEDAAEECTTVRGGKTFFKRRYRCEAEIPGRLRDDPSASWYRCRACGCLHVVRSRVGLTGGQAVAACDGAVRPAASVPVEAGRALPGEGVTTWPRA